MPHKSVPSTPHLASTAGLTMTCGNASDTVQRQSQERVQHLALMVGKPFQSSMMHAVQSKKDHFVQLASDREFFASPFAVFNELGNIILAAAEAAGQLLPDPLMAKPAMKTLQKSITVLVKTLGQVTEVSINDCTAALDSAMETAMAEMLSAHTQKAQYSSQAIPRRQLFASTAFFSISIFF